MNYYDEIKNKILDDEVYSKVKDYSKERHRVITYFEIGIIICKENNKYVIKYCSDKRIISREYKIMYN